MQDLRFHALLICMLLTSAVVCLSRASDHAEGQHEAELCGCVLSEPSAVSPVILWLRCALVICRLSCYQEKGLR